MRDKELYTRILGVEAPWHVREVDLELQAGEVSVYLEIDQRESLRCPVCGKESAGYDSRERRWRHLDTCQYRTIVVAQVPRIRCPEHGVRQISVPWSEPGSRFTALFEALVIDWLQEASMSAVGRQGRFGHAFQIVQSCWESLLMPIWPLPPPIQLLPGLRQPRGLTILRMPAGFS